MPRKTKTKSAAITKSPEARQTKERRKAVPRKRLPAPLTGRQIASEQASNWTVCVGAGVSDPSPTVLPQPRTCPSDDGVDSDLPAPRSAWMVFGSDRAYPSDAALEQVDEVGSWTASKNVEIGDTLFFYFIHSKKAIHFVARATSLPCLGGPLYGKPGGRRQWRVEYDWIVRIDPITLAEIRTVFEEKNFLPYLMGAKYIRPDFANHLLERSRIAFPLSGDDARKALQRVVGKEELGNPATTSLAGLRAIPSAAFKCEEEVEYYLLEPLLRLAQVAKQARVQRRYDVPVKIRGRKRDTTADYAVLDGRNVRCIVEAKLDLGKGNTPEKKQDILQVREYAKKSRAPVFVLMDHDRVFCFRTGEEMPCLTIDRKRLNEADLNALRAHILGAH
jgi:hypothetical protein